jgi:hypothetical protein
VTYSHLRPDILAVRELISEPTRWCVEDYARTADGEGTYGNDSNAVCWCIWGAIDKVVGDDTAVNDLIHETLSDLSFEMFGLCLGSANDARGHGAMLRLLDTWLERNP